MGSTWVLWAPDGPHTGPMNLAIGNSFSNMLFVNIYGITITYIPVRHDFGEFKLKKKHLRILLWPGILEKTFHICVNQIKANANKCIGCWSGAGWWSKLFCWNDSMVHVSSSWQGRFKSHIHLWYFFLRKEALHWYKANAWYQERTQDIIHVMSHYDVPSNALSNVYQG